MSNKAAKTQAELGDDDTGPVATLPQVDLLIPLASGGPFKWHGPFQRAAMRIRLVPALMEKLAIDRDEAVAQFKELSNATLLQAVNSVAVAKGFVVPTAIGDGKLLELFMAFLTEHWDEILKLILMLFGLGLEKVQAEAANKGPAERPKLPIPESSPKPKSHS